MNDRVAIVTGASRGLGKAIAHTLVGQGVHVVMAARGGGQLAAAAGELDSSFVRPVSCDIRNEVEIERLILKTLDWFGHIDILVCNAGIYGPIGPIDQIDWHAWLDAIQTNLIGTVACCRAVLPQMRHQRHGKIVVVSGGGASSPMPNFSAYAASKTALVRFVETLAVEMRDSNIDVNAVAPGALNTSMLDEVLEAGPDQAGQDFYARAVAQKQQGGASLEQAAELVNFLASSVTDGISGCLFSAVWDDWRNLPKMRQKLAQSDIYRLRRVEHDRL